MSVALKSLQLTVRPGDSPQDWGIPPAGLGAWQVRKMQIRVLFKTTDQVKIYCLLPTGY